MLRKPVTHSAAAAVDIIHYHTNHILSGKLVSRGHSRSPKLHRSSLCDEMSKCFAEFVIVSFYRVDRKTAISLELKPWTENDLCIKQQIRCRPEFKSPTYATWVCLILVWRNAEYMFIKNNSHKEVGGQYYQLLYLKCADICKPEIPPIYLT